MSMIIPAGTMSVQWSPEDAKLTKTASTGEQVVENALYAAAKKHFASVAEKTEAAPVAEEKKEKCEKCCKDVCECKKEACAQEEEVVIDVADKGTEATPCACEGEGDVATKVDEAVAKIEEATAELKDAVGTTDVPGEKEVDGDIIVESAPEGVDEVEIEIEDTAAEGEPKEVEIEIGDDNKEESFADKFAGSDEEFCKYAKLSPSNKKKLADYWKNALGFPPDYVALMTKDYEK